MMTPVEGETKGMRVERDDEAPLLSRRRREINKDVRHAPFLARKRGRAVTIGGLYGLNGLKR